MRIALRIAYDGAGMSGSQRQPHGNTVEDRLLKAMTRVGVISDPREARFGMGARTDKGVSAIANTAAIDTAFPPDAVLPALAGRLDDVWAWAVAEAPDIYDPRRHAKGRRYWYFAPAVGDLHLARAAFALFQGTHDFRGFCKRQPEDAGWRRRIHVASVSDLGALWRFDVAADAFLWQQVRRMVGAATEVAAGRANVEDVRARLVAGDGTVFPIAPPEPLVLVEVEAPLPWRIDEIARQALVEGLSNRAATASMRASALEQMSAQVGAAGAPKG